MTAQTQQILAQVLKLSPVERAELVEQILVSFEFADRDAIDALWAEEVEARIDAYERGEAKGIPAQEVFERIKRQSSE